jgi:hypothetical protein
MDAPPLPIDGRPLRLTLGLRPLALDEWLVVDDAADAELALKEELLTTRPDAVLAHLPRGDRGAAEVLGLVRSFLAAHHPDRNRPLPSALHPIDAAGRLVQEDLCVCSPGPGGWVLTSASVCFPSRWRLADKIGRDLHAVHGPVPGYEDRMAVPVDRVFDGLTPDHPRWRLNWTVLDDPALFQPDPAGRAAAAGPVDPAALWFRTERQTLRALPDSGDVLFTIRTTVAPLAGLAPAERLLLAGTLRTVEPATARYKGWEPLLPALLDWLDDAREH